MFRISACISLAVDIFLFCWYIWLIENGKIAYQFHFTIPVLVLIVLRVLAMLVFIHLYRIRAELRSLFFPYLITAANFGFVVLQLVLHKAPEIEAIVFALSIVSCLCHLNCIRELKSTIVPIKTVALGLSRKYYDAAKQKKLIQSRYGNPRGPASHPADQASYAPVFLSQLQDKFYSARNSWNNQVEKLRTLFNQCQSMVSSNTRRNSGGSSEGNVYLTKEIFDAILLTIIGDTIQDREVAIENLLSIFEDYPFEIEFFIPQIALFLLYGAFELEEKLKKKLLFMCERNLSFAYKLYWFIDSFCLPKSASSSSSMSPSKSLQLGGLSLSHDELDHHHHRHLLRMDSDAREILHQFQEMIIQIGNKSCLQFIQIMRTKVLFASRDNSNNYLSSSNNLSEKNLKSEEKQPLLMNENDYGSIKLPLERSEDHDIEESISQSIEEGKPLSYPSRSAEKLNPFHFPLQLTIFPPSFQSYSSLLHPESIPYQPNTPNKTLFELQLDFWNELIEMTRGLFPLSKIERKSFLEKRLHEINHKYLPSSLIHIPLGNTQHRIWKIHVNECFSFATKERTPVMICFEILYFNFPKKKKITSGKWWSFSNLKSKFRSDNLSSTQQKSSSNLKSHLSVADSSESLITYYDSNYSSLFPSHKTPGIVSTPPDRRSSGDNLLPRQAHHHLQHHGEDEVKSEGTIDEKIMKSRTPSPPVLGQWSSPPGGRSFSERPTISASSINKIGSRSSLAHSWNSSPQNLKPIDEGIDLETGSIIGDRAAIHLEPADVGNPTKKLTFLTHSLDDRFDYIRSLERGKDHPPAGNGAGKRPETSPEESVEIDGSIDYETKSEQSSDDDDEEEEQNYLGDSPKDGSRSFHNHRNHPPEPSAPDSFETISSKILFKEKWKLKEERIKQDSVIGHFKGWKLVPVIMKSNDDLRQEQIASQIIAFMSKLLDESPLKIPNRIKAYSIVAISSDSGLIEAIPNTVSIDVIKKKELGYGSLSNFFEKYFEMETNPKKYQQAQENFIISMANYSIICYLLNIKDRHNGNILITTHGSLVHIDFGFILAKTPGGNLGFEKAPFKLIRDYVDIMGGENHPGFQRFRQICVMTFLELRRHYQRILLYLETISKGNEHLACFNNNPTQVLQEMCERFFPQMNDHAAEHMVHSLINESLDHWTTNAYDQYQRLCQGIF